MTSCDSGSSSSGGTTRYKVEFDLNGGSGTAPAAVTVDKGKSTTIPGVGQMVAPTGKAFDDGWYEGSATGTKLNTGASYTPTKNVKLYAAWRTTVAVGTPAVVKFDKNGAEGTTPDDIESQVGEYIDLPDQGDMTNNDFVFLGWNDNKNALTGNKNRYEVVVEEITLYAIWLDPSQFSAIVWFDTNAPSWAPNATDAVPNYYGLSDEETKAKLPTVNPIYDPAWAAGVTFDSWNKKS